MQDIYAAAPMGRKYFPGGRGRARRTFALMRLAPALAAILSANIALADAPPRPHPAFARSARTDWNPSLLAADGVDPKALARCTHDRRWGSTLGPDADAGASDMMKAIGPELAPTADRAAVEKRLRSLLFWRMVRASLLEGDNNNVGMLPLAGRTWTDAKGRKHPVVVFRSGITPHPDAGGSCFDELLSAGHVRHVVNLFDGEIPVADLVAEESKNAAEHSATYVTASDDPAAYGPWRDLLRKSYDDPAARQRAMEGVARLVRDQILAPGGKPPTGNIHIHCGGGMHRSGMIAGVVEKCVDRLPMATVEAHYLWHVDWRDAEHPGGAEDNNLRFLRDFDCKLLDGK